MFYGEFEWNSKGGVIHWTHHDPNTSHHYVWLKHDGLQRVMRWFLTANVLLLPFMALQMYFHPLILVASLWGITFPGSTWDLAILIRRAATTTACQADDWMRLRISIVILNTCYAQTVNYP